ncbi:MAG: hypothetical protein IPM47_06255 [Sphingobacteriales bacterium]|nr:MAG: hypothetical protein IPM47_06255 [Sphingobacteriales bacterium]
MEQFQFQGNLPLFITPCCKEKTTDLGLIPAILRYTDPRISEIYSLSLSKPASFGILSGKYGLIFAEEPIPWYDEVLTLETWRPLTATIKKQLKQFQASEVLYFAKNHHLHQSWEPYYLAIQISCQALNLPYVFIEIPG